jgi:inosine/xanthosine triphosphatase
LTDFEIKHLLVAVGSNNPTKVKAVESILSQAVMGKLIPQVVAAEVLGIEVPTGVAAQPVGDEETIRGALNRAAAVLEKLPEANWGVGIEGGVVYHTIEGKTQLLTCAWCAIRDRKGNSSYGGGLFMPLPPTIVTDIEAGYELGDATDRLFAVTGSKRAGGALGHLSKGLENRQQAYESIFTYALSKFLNPELYELIGNV